MQPPVLNDSLVDRVCLVGENKNGMDGTSSRQRISVAGRLVVLVVDPRDR